MTLMCDVMECDGQGPPTYYLYRRRVVQPWRKQLIQLLPLSLHVNVKNRLFNIDE